MIVVQRDMMTFMHEHASSHPLTHTHTHTHTHAHKVAAGTAYAL